MKWDKLVNSRERREHRFYYFYLRNEIRDSWRLLWTSNPNFLEIFCCPLLDWYFLIIKLHIIYSSFHIEKYKNRGEHATKKKFLIESQENWQIVFIVEPQLLGCSFVSYWKLSKVFSNFSYSDTLSRVSQDDTRFNQPESVHRANFRPENFFSERRIFIYAERSPGKSLILQNLLHTLPKKPLTIYTKFLYNV